MAIIYIIRKMFPAIIIGLMFSHLKCSDNTPLSDDEDPVIDKQEPIEEIVGSIPNTVFPDIVIMNRAAKISQLTGDYDKHLNIPTLSQSRTRFGIEVIDLGVPFQDGDTTWLLFGDTWGPKGGLLDAVGYTTDKNPDKGLKIDFLVDEHNIYKPINIPSISQGAFEVPNEGIVINNEFYVWHTTDYNPINTMGRNVLAHAYREEAIKGEYKLLYNFSVSKFINVSVVQVSNSDWDLLPEDSGEGLIIFGSGDYRASHLYLAYQPLSGLKLKGTIRYFAGLKDGKPLWNINESDAQPVFDFKNPSIGEFSVTYNSYINRWIVLYGHHDPRGINLRTSQYPWGPWSDAQLLFDPWLDGGYCNFMHTSWDFSVCDWVHNPGREYEWGGEYGPYQFAHFATGDKNSTTIYFTLSTWNPYEVVLMKAGLRKR